MSAAKGKVSLGTLLDAAMKASTQGEARKHMEGIMDFLRAHTEGKDDDALAMLALENLGYWAGYSSHERRALVEGLYGCEHPVFGTIAEYGVPTPEIAFNAGLEIAKATSTEAKALIIQGIRKAMKAARFGITGAVS